MLVGTIAMKGEDYLLAPCGRGLRASPERSRRVRGITLIPSADLRTGPGQSHLNWGYVVRRKALKRHTVLSDLPIICWTIRFV